MILLRYATASQEVPLGYYLDNLDGDTPETGLTIANTAIKLWKRGGSSILAKSAGGATHMADGVYYTTLNEDDTDTLGPLVIFSHVSGALTVKVTCCVLPPDIYDAIVDDVGVVAGVTVVEALRRIGMVSSSNITNAETLDNPISHDWALSAQTATWIVDQYGNRTATFN